MPARPPKGLELANPDPNDMFDGSHSMNPPPIYRSSSVQLPPSYSPPQYFQANRTNSLQISAHDAHSHVRGNTTDIGWGLPRTPPSDSETYISDDMSLSYQETVGAFPLSDADPHNVAVVHQDRKGVYRGVRQSTPSDDTGLYPQDSVSASGSGASDTRYIYYQVYSEGEAIHAKTFFTEEDPLLGRVVAKRIAPPHTAASVKRFLCKQEGISDYNGTALFSAMSSPSSLADQDHVSIVTPEGPGSSPEEPMALVISDLPIQIVTSRPAPAPLPRPSTPRIGTPSIGTPSIHTLDSKPLPKPLCVVGDGPPIDVHSQTPIKEDKPPSKADIKRSKTAAKAEAKAEKKKRKKEEAKARQVSMRNTPQVAVAASLFYGAR